MESLDQPWSWSWKIIGVGIVVERMWDFPGSTVVKNLPANARDMVLSPGLGRYHMPQSNEARTPQLLSLRATTTEAHTPRSRAPQQEKPPQ